MSKLKKLLGKRIKEIRLSKNLTQEQLGELTGIGASSLSKIESGIYHPSDDNLEKISSALDVEPYKLYMFNHHKNMCEIKKEIITIIENLNDDKTKLIYKILDVL